MYSKEVLVTNPVGLHARPATYFIHCANDFKSNIWISRDDKKVNAKSLLGVLSLGISRGMSITITADGADEEKAVNFLVDLILSNFEE